MSVNKYKPHIWLIPEDEATRQLANGFVGHWAVNDRVVQIVSPVKGWKKVLVVFINEYISLLRKFDGGYVIMLIDFDSVSARRAYFEERIPVDLKSRVFVIGSRIEAENLPRELGMHLEQIGVTFAEDCSNDLPGLWDHPLLNHNREEVDRMISIVKPFLFQAEEL